MNSDNLENQLAFALNRLKHTAFDKAFLDNKETVAPDRVPRAFFSFLIGHVHFLVESNTFCEVFVDTPIAPIPNAPPLLVGLCNTRGMLIPVYQLHSVLNCSRPKRPVIFCIGKGMNAVGVIIDALPTSLSLCLQDRTLSDPTKIPLRLQPLLGDAYFTGGDLFYHLNNALLGEHLLKMSELEIQSPLVGVQREVVVEHQLS